MLACMQTLSCNTWILWSAAFFPHLVCYTTHAYDTLVGSLCVYEKLVYRSWDNVDQSEASYVGARPPTSLGIANCVVRNQNRNITHCFRFTRIFEKIKHKQSVFVVRKPCSGRSFKKVLSGQWIFHSQDVDF